MAYGLGYDRTAIAAYSAEALLPLGLEIDQLVVVAAAVAVVAAGVVAAAAAAAAAAVVVAAAAVAVVGDAANVESAAIVATEDGRQ